MLVGLWLIVLGVSNAIGYYYIYRQYAISSGKVIEVSDVLIALWKTLPLWVGIALFRNQRFFVHLLYGQAITEENERNHWGDTRFLSTLVLGLLGLLFLASGLKQLCESGWILGLIVHIDTPYSSDYRKFTIWEKQYWDQWLHTIPIFYPIILGTILVLGAGRLGDVMGLRIEKSLETPPENEEDSV